MEAAEAGKGYIGYYDGGAFGIPHSSKNKEAALLFLQYIGQPSVQPGWAVAAPRVTNTSTYDDPKVKEMDAKLDGYYTLLSDKGKLFAGAPPYPFHAQVREATAPFFYEAITGQLTPAGRARQDGRCCRGRADEARLSQVRLPPGRGGFGRPGFSVVACSEPLLK